MKGLFVCYKVPFGDRTAIAETLVHGIEVS
jgi:hypothetical protein